MRIFEGQDINSLYITAANALLHEGEDILKNGKIIREIYPCLIKIKNPKEGLLLVEGRPYSPAFLIAEALWNLSGDTEDWLCNYNKTYKKYFTDGQLKAGYGNRIFNWDGNINQFELVSKRLLEEPFTQHAGITIFNPTYDLNRPKFVPCIVKLKFKIREGKLHMTTFMRAQDIWLGFPYDINLLLTIFQMMAISVNKPMGDYYHYCDVLRIYEEDFGKIKNLKLSGSHCNNFIDLKNVCDFEKFKNYRNLIKYLPHNTVELAENEPEYWRNGIKACLSYSLIHKGKYKEAYELIATINNCLKDQFAIWSSYYHKPFYNYVKSLGNF